jgi:hypothetical protein
MAGRTRDARRILDKLIGAFGRRKSTERANVHVELAMVAKGGGQERRGARAVELASRWTPPTRASQDGRRPVPGGSKPDEAERTYRALLLLVRRQPPADDIDAVSASEVLFSCT